MQNYSAPISKITFIVHDFLFLVFHQDARLTLIWLAQDFSKLYVWFLCFNAVQSFFYRYFGSLEVGRSPHGANE